MVKFNSRHGATTDSGKKITADLVDGYLKEEADKVKEKFGEKNTETARAYISAQAHAPVLSDFLTSDMLSHLEPFVASK